MGSNYIEMRLEDCMDAIIDYRGKTPKIWPATATTIAALPQHSGH